MLGDWKRLALRYTCNKKTSWANLANSVCWPHFCARLCRFCVVIRFFHLHWPPGSKDSLTPLIIAWISTFLPVSMLLCCQSTSCPCLWTCFANRRTRYRSCHQNQWRTNCWMLHNCNVSEMSVVLSVEWWVLSVECWVMGCVHVIHGRYLKQRYLENGENITLRCTRASFRVMNIMYYKHKKKRWWEFQTDFIWSCGRCFRVL